MKRKLFKELCDSIKEAGRMRRKALRGEVPRCSCCGRESVFEMRSTRLYPRLCHRCGDNN